MGHYNNLHDRTRTVARVKALNTDFKVYSPYRARMSEIKGMNLKQGTLQFLRVTKMENISNWVGIDVSKATQPCLYPSTWKSMFMLQIRI
jgi:hypothetical protein